MITRFFSRLKRNAYAYELVSAWVQIKDEIDEALDDDEVGEAETLVKELEWIEDEMTLLIHEDEDMW